jgi:hypothetical protein
MDKEETQRKVTAAKQEGLLEGEKKKARAIAKSLRACLISLQRPCQSLRWGHEKYLSQRYKQGSIFVN